jgi:hypothetical protein
MKHVYVVIGMARSGTSAIARGLKALGVDLGQHLIPADQAWNAKGFWEDTDIVYKVNRSVLAALQQEWTNTAGAYARHKNTAELQTLKKAATHLLKQRIANVSHWGFKDPRTSMLLPFWKDIFAALQVEERYVIALRNPLASAHSYQKVMGVDLEEGLLLWLMHLIPAIDETQGKKRLIVSYDLLLKDTYKQLLRMHDALHIPLPLDLKEISEYSNEFLDKRLHHHEYNNDDLLSHPAAQVVPLCARTYTLLQRLANDEITFDSHLFQNAWQSIKEEFAHMQPVYGYINTLLNRNKTLVRENRKIAKSLPWRLIYPLRLIDDTLRQLRRLIKKKRKLANING